MNTAQGSATGKRRIFIDFTLVDYRTRVTGIPRVAYAYLEEGYSLSYRGGFEVIPVYVRDGELHDARPLLIGSNWRHFRRHRNARSLYQLARSAMYFVLHSLRLLAITAVVPFLAVGTFLFSFAFFDLWKHKAEAAFRRVYFALKDAINRRLMRRLPFAQGDLLFMPAYWHDTPPGYYTRLRRRGLIICPLVHDILPITHAEHYESPWRDQFKSYVYETLSQADHVYYVSEFSRRSTEEVNAEQIGVQLPEGTVLHHGYDFASFLRRDAGSTQAPRARSGAVQRVLEENLPYLLMVGSIEPKKNHLAALAEFERLWARKVEVSLVIVGRGGWKDHAIREAIERNPHLHASLIWLQDVTDDDLALLYRKAAGLIQASEAEGFGLPVIEALALDVPVLANDIPVFREIASGFATFFDIGVEGDLADKVEAVLRGEVKAARVDWPTWRERAEILYRDLLARTPRSRVAEPRSAEQPAPAKAA